MELLYCIMQKLNLIVYWIYCEITSHIAIEESEDSKHHKYNKWTDILATDLSEAEQNRFCLPHTSMLQGNKVVCQVCFVLVNSKVEDALIEIQRGHLIRYYLFDKIVIERDNL